MSWIAQADGLYVCSDHTTAPFAGHVGCPVCSATPPTPQPDTPGPAETELITATKHRLPTTIEVERRTWLAWSAVRSETTKCRQLAVACEARAAEFVTGKYAKDPSDPEFYINEEQARKWLDVAAKFRQGVAKSIDTQAKMMKIGEASAAMRERRAAKERRDKLIMQLRRGKI